MTEPHRFSTGRRFAATFGPALVVLLVGALAYSGIQRTIGSSDRVEEGYRVLVVLERMFSRLKDAETAERGYVLTGEERYLEPYRNVREDLARYLQTLRALLMNPVQEARVEALVPRIEERLALVDRNVALRRSGQADAAEMALESDRGEASMDTIRAAMREIEEAQEGILRARVERDRANARLLIAVVVVGTLLAVGLAFLSNLLLGGYARDQERLGRQLEAAYADLQRANRTVHDRERQFRTLADSIPQLAWMADAEGSLFWYNQRWYDYTGTTLEEVKGWGWREVQHPDEVDRVVASITHAFETGEPWEDVSPLRGRDGRYRWFLSRAVPVRDEQGEVVRWFGTSTDIEDERRAGQERDRALAEAREANRAKSEFLANMSHELRTPINAIIGYTDLLDLGIVGAVNSAQKAQLERIRVSSRHLLGLINEILDLAKIEARRMQVRREPAKVSEAVKAALVLIHPQAEEAGVRVEDDCEVDAAYVGDPDRVRQILLNLLSNAVKFTERGGRITVSCDTREEPDAGAGLAGDGPWVGVRVQDTGIGIAAEQLASIFHPFVQNETGRTRTREGTGLGLTISREFARLMGGDLTVRSEPGKGSSFTLWLPTVAEDAVPLEPLRPMGFRETRGVPHGLARVGALLKEEVDAVLQRYTARMRDDPLLPAAQRTDAELEDHTSSFLVDIAQSLIVMAETGGEPELMRDGSDIQRLIAERHGAQRARLGWTEEAVEREFGILWEEVEGAVRRGAPADAEIDGAVGVLARFLVHSRRVSLRGMRRARGAGTSAPPTPGG